MNALLDLAINAHGGLDRWNKVTSIKVDTSITGAIWCVQGRVDGLKDVVINAETKRERLTMEFPGQNKRTIFEPDRVVVQTAQGETLTVRDDPKESFEGQTLETPWEDVQVAYFSGEAMWSYLNIPFLYEQPGFEADEITPIQVDGERWRRLKVSFPENVRGHARTQICCFGPDGLLRRHDYTVDVLGGAKALNYASHYRRGDGIVFSGHSPCYRLRRRLPACAGATTGCDRYERDKSSLGGAAASARYGLGDKAAGRKLCRRLSKKKIRRF